MPEGSQAFTLYFTLEQNEEMQIAAHTCNPQKAWQQS